MSEVARALGFPGAIEWRGERLAVSRVTFEVEGLFEVWLENNLTAALERSRQQPGSPDLYRDRLREANAQLAARELCWEGEACRRATFTPAGFRELAYLCLSRERPGWTREQHAELCRRPGEVCRADPGDPSGECPPGKWVSRRPARSGGGAGRHLTTTELFAALVGEPHCLRLDEIARLDRWQVIGIYFAPRDDNGAVIGSGGGAGSSALAAGRSASPRELFFAHWRRVSSLAFEVIARLWERHQAEQRRARGNGRP